MEIDIARFGTTYTTNDLTAAHDLAFSNPQDQYTFVVPVGANYQINVKAIWNGNEMYTE